MKTRIKLLLIIVTLAVTMSLMSNTYSRYVADTTGNLEVQLATWKILVNESDISSGNVSSVELTPIIEKNDNVASNKLAPSSEGYFDIQIDPSNTEVTFDYIISLEVLNENVPDLLISEYAIINEEEKEEDNIQKTTIENNEIRGTMFYKNVASGSDESFEFKPFTIRVYFEWYDGETASMNDEADTLVGTSQENETLQIRANIKFEQNINGKTISPSE